MGEDGVEWRGMARMPTKRLSISCRRSPCGEGTNTYDMWEMRIYKRVLRVTCPKEQVK
jgi:small subunit ribosomal protein S20e